MTIRGIVAGYLFFVSLPFIAAVVLVVIAARKRIKMERLANPEKYKNKRPSRWKRKRRFFIVRK